jgi:lipopolysaccharide transport system permease protein
MSTPHCGTTHDHWRMTSRSTIDLCLFLTRAELARRHAGTSFGAGWSLLLPLVAVFATWVALDAALGLGKSLGPGYGHGLVAALAPWLFVSEAVNASLGSIRGQPNLVKKTVFPVALLPISTVLASAAGHALVLVALIAALWLSGVTPSRASLTLPIWFAAAVVFAVACGTLVAALNVVFPDAGAIVPSLVSIWFWLSPVVWPLAQVGEGWRMLALANPMTPIIEGYRYALLGGPFPDGMMVAALIGTAALGAVSLATFSRVRPIFADAL